MEYRECPDCKAKVGVVENCETCGGSGWILVIDHRRCPKCNARLEVYQQGGIPQIRR